MFLIVFQFPDFMEVTPNWKVIPVFMFFLSRYLADQSTGGEAKRIWLKIWEDL